MSAVSGSALASQWSAGSRPGATGAEIRGHLRPRGAPYTCLFSAQGHELRSTLLGNGDSDALAELIRLCRWNKDVGDVASPRSVERPISMHPLGG
jgi:cyclic pyranopterin phosphate synthase